MIHKITIEIESEKEWSAVCALSSLLKTPLSELAKKDLISCTESIAKRLNDDKLLVNELGGGKNSENVKRLLAILK